MDTEVTDLGFEYDWLILDLIMKVERKWSPMNLQVCDPEQPTTVVSGGPGRRRFEFIRLPDQTMEELKNEETAWRLLEKWDVNPVDKECSIRLKELKKETDDYSVSFFEQQYLLSSISAINGNNCSSNKIVFS